MTTGLYTPRHGQPAPDGPFTGVPKHLKGPLTRWLQDEYKASGGRMDEDGLENLATVLRVDVSGVDGHGMFAGLLAWSDFDEERFLNLIHYTLNLPSKTPRDWARLERLLAFGGSVWRATGWGLETRVDGTATAAFEQAVKPQDAASNELEEAWTKAYGRNPDASDAWDHAIKAVEAILRGITSPSNTQATLGTLIRDLRNGAHKFEFVLTNDLGGVQTLLAMLQLMWPNPDRHGDLQQRHTPSLEEAHAVVQLAVAIVQWGRDGQIVRT